MVKPNYLIFTISLLITLSCEKDAGDFRLSCFEIPKIEGYILRSLDGTYLGEVGTPNRKNIDYSTGYSFVFASNPAFERFYLSIGSPGGMSTKKMWITMAQFGDQLPDYSVDNGMTNMIAGGKPLIQKEFNEDHLDVDVSSLQEGYYRIYLQIHNVLLYDNLVIYDFNN